jgi:hypothetical protein
MSNPVLDGKIFSWENNDRGEALYKLDRKDEKNLRDKFFDKRDIPSDPFLPCMVVILLQFNQYGVNMQKKQSE